MNSTQGSPFHCPILCATLSLALCMRNLRTNCCLTLICQKCFVKCCLIKVYVRESIIERFITRADFCKKHENVAAAPAARWLLWRHSVTSCDIVTSCNNVTWRHVTSWHHTIGQALVSIHLNQSTHKWCIWPGDLDLRPMTLSIKLVQDTIKVNPCTKFGDRISNGSTVRVLTHRHTNMHADRTVFITPTADAGGKNYTHTQTKMLATIGQYIGQLSNNTLNIFISQQNEGYSYSVSRVRGWALCISGITSWTTESYFMSFLQNPTSQTLISAHGCQWKIPYFTRIRVPYFTGTPSNHS